MTARQPQQPGEQQIIRVGFDERLLAEVVRLREEAGEAEPDSQADLLPQRMRGDFEKRILLRAVSHRDADALRRALKQVHWVAAGAIIGVLLLAALAGATTARAALVSPPNEPVNFFWALGGVLGVETLALLLWLALVVIRPAALGGASLGGLVFALGRKIARWMHKGPVHVAAARATASVFARGAVGRWTLSAISHGIWTVFLGACLGLLLVMLSARQYTFAWETTILSSQTYVPLTHAIATVPEALGFVVPTDEQIRTSQWMGEGELPTGAENAWSGLLIGSIVAYGLLPRMLLLLMCLWLRFRAMRRFRLDTSLPGYARLRPRLEPVTKPIGVVDGEDQDAALQSSATEAADDEADVGPLAVLALEMEPPDDWPPDLHGITWLDLGTVESREDRHRVTARLENERHGQTVVVASLTSTPDRGVQTFLESLRKVSPRRFTLLLTGGQKLRERESSERVEARVVDWYRLAGRAGLPDARVLEVDLDHLTYHSRVRLRGFLGADVDEYAKARLLEEACHLIVEHAQKWDGSPDAAGQAELHRAIAKLYGGESEGLLARLKHRLVPSGDLKAQLAGEADRVLHLLPARLRLKPRWLAAGALSGAMGCVAAATLVTPGAIAALPMWSGLGAAVAGVLQTMRGESNGRDAAETTGDLAEAVAAAALFAMLLELQGRPEATISRVLDQAIGDHDPRMETVEQAATWLDELRHRFDMALAKEAAA